MHELSLHDIDQISRDIRKQEITFSHLLDDLIDHICCDVEYEMQKGLNYTEAYRKVKQKMGYRRIKEIQEETLFLVDTKYRKMKKTMKITGIAGTTMFGLAALFKIQHWPLAGTMLTLGALILAFGFLPSALGVLWKETHNRKRIFLFISAFFAGILYIMATLFKIQHWPAAGMLLSLAWICGIFLFIPALVINRFSDQEKKDKRPVYSLGAAGLILYSSGMLFKIMHWPLATLFLVLGVLILCLIALPWYTWITWKEESHIKAGFIFIIVGALIIVVPGALINLSLQRSYEIGFYSHMNQQQALYNTISMKNQTFLYHYQDSSNFPEMSQLQAKTNGLLMLIDNITKEMIEESEGKPGMPAVNPDQIKQTEPGQKINYELLSRPFNPGPVIDFLKPGSISRQELETALKEYDEYISALPVKEELQKYKDLLQPSIYLPDEIPEGVYISLMAGLQSLQLLKNSIMTFESYAFSAIVRH